MDANTISDTTFKLKQSGNTTKIAADVRYDSATRKATLVQRSSLGAGLTYKAVVTTGPRT